MFSGRFSTTFKVCQDVGQAGVDDRGGAHGQVQGGRGRDKNDDASGRGVGGGRLEHALGAVGPAEYRGDGGVERGSEVSWLRLRCSEVLQFFL